MSRLKQKWRGLSDKLNIAFPDIIPVPRPLVKNNKVKETNWLAGFVAGEACFFVKISKNTKSKLGVIVSLSFQLTQHSRDAELMRSFIEFFSCGNVHVNENKAWLDFRVSKIKDIIEKIIPFLNNIQSLVKRGLISADWCQVAEIIKNKKHLTKEGLDQIKKNKIGYE